jgi:hypothetical protein
LQNKLSSIDSFLRAFIAEKLNLEPERVAKGKETVLASLREDMKNCEVFITMDMATGVEILQV